MSPGWTVGGQTYSAGTSWSARWDYDPNAPYLHGGTDPEFSSSMALALREPDTIWDVNRYYRDLGIKAPYRPTRPQIRAAFRDSDRGSRETFCVSQLLNPEIRRRYDAAPWGTKFMDVYVWAEQKAKVRAEMLKRRLDTEDEPLVRRVMERMGIPVEAPDSPDSLDNGSKPSKDERRTPAGFAYAYYLWKTTDFYGDRRILQLWQPLVVRALSDLGVTMRVSLGLMGRTPHEWSTGVVGYRKVAYFNREVTPSAEVAAKVAKALTETAQLNRPTSISPKDDHHD